MNRVYGNRRNTTNSGSAKYVLGSAMVLMIAVLVLHVGGVLFKVMFRSDLPILASSTVNLLLLVIAALLLIGTLGLLFGRALVSLLSLSAVVGVYIIWYLLTIPDRAVLRTDPFYRQHPEAAISHPLGLVEGQWWNVAVFGLSTLILVLLIIGIKRHSRF